MNAACGGDGGARLSKGPKLLASCSPAPPTKPNLQNRMVIQEMEGVEPTPRDMKSGTDRRGPN
eukprot:8207032-Pyramimonas_sp.AAC.1